ncbi:lytic transglycosylase domain-containing protein [Saccharopolyspora pogona]|uniref:lytic transglycosylase domain-containing protein n=1 Tax=Saccharopolyspora pogona TaxID=333966 RepID=UPI001CC23EB4|nr:transglycosylase SLT domain-containing protein [Saccharopolyspora pogona]
MAFDAGAVEASLTIDRTPFQRGLQQARKDADRFERDPISVRLDVDAARAGVRLADWRRLQEAKALAVGINVDTVGAGARMATWRNLQEARAINVPVVATADWAAATKAGDEVGRSASEASRSTLLSGMRTTTKLIAAGIVAGAPLIGAALIGSVGAGFVALAAVAQHNNEQIRASFEQLKTDVIDVGKDITSQSVPALDNALRTLDAEVRILGVQMRGAMAAANPQIAIVTTGLVNMADNAVPGVTAALRNGQPVAQGFANLLADLGLTGGEALTSLSAHAGTFGTVFTSTGSIVRSVIGAVTTVINDLASIWASNSAQMNAAIGGVARTVTGLADGAMPVLTLALRVVAGVVDALTTILGPFDGILGTVGATALVTWAALKGAGAVTGGITALAGGILNLGARMEGVSPRAANMSGKVAALAEGLAGPLGLAIAGATVALGLLAASQQKAAEKAQAHKSLVESVASALRESNNAIDENVRKTTAQQIQGDASYDTFRRVGVSLTELTDIALGNAGAYDAVNARLAGLIVNGSKTVDTGHGTARMFTAQGEAAQQAQGYLDLLRATYGDAAVKNRDLAAAIVSTQVTTDPLIRAFMNLANATGTAEQETNAFRAALDALIGRNLGAEQAALSFQQAVIGLSNSVRANGVTLDANTAAGVANRQAILNSLQAAVNHAQAVQQQTGDVNAAKEALRQNEQALRDNAIKVYGNRDAVDELLRSVGGLPGQYNSAEEQARQFARNTNTELQGIQDKNIKVTASGEWYDQFDFKTDAYLGYRTRAAGGPVYGPGTSTSDSIPTLLSNGEYVINAASTRAYYPLIEAINQNQLAKGGQPIPVKRLAVGGPVGLGYSPFTTDLGGAAQTWLNRRTASFGDRIAGVFRDMLAGAGGGDVSRWSSVILQALSMLGQPASWLPTVSRRMNQESGGNPTVVNTWDSNWRKGTPSVGLMQVIGPTYQRWAGPFRGTGPFLYGTSTNPLANTYAGLNYAIHRYGSLAALNRPGGYDNGGALEPGYTLTYNGTRHPENVRTRGQEDELVTRLVRIEAALSARPPVTVQQSFAGNQWEPEELAAASARHMTAALKELDG